MQHLISRFTLQHVTTCYNCLHLINIFLRHIHENREDILNLEEDVCRLTEYIGIQILGCWISFRCFLSLPKLLPCISKQPVTESISLIITFSHLSPNLLKLSKKRSSLRISTRMGALLHQATGQRLEQATVERQCLVFRVGRLAYPKWLLLTFPGWAFAILGRHASIVIGGDP